MRQLVKVPVFRTPQPPPLISNFDITAQSTEGQRKGEKKKFNSEQMFGNFRFKMAIPGAILTNLQASGMKTGGRGLHNGCGDKSQRRATKEHVNDT